MVDAQSNVAPVRWRKYSGAMGLEHEIERDVPPLLSALRTAALPAAAATAAGGCTPGARAAQLAAALPRTTHGDVIDCAGAVVKANVTQTGLREWSTALRDVSTGTQALWGV